MVHCMQFKKSGFWKSNPNELAIRYTDSSIAPRKYFEQYILVEYCMDIKKRAMKRYLLIPLANDHKRANDELVK